MNLLQCFRLAVCAAVVTFLGGCGSSSSNQTAPQTVSVFYSHSAIFNNTSTVMTAGYNAFGQLGNNTLDNRSSFDTVQGLSLATVKGFSAGGAHTLAFAENGTVQAWGSNQYGQLGDKGTTTGGGAVSRVPVTVVLAGGTPLTNVTGVAAGGYHSLAISGGNVYAWGNNGSGQLGNGDAGFSDRNVAVPVVTQDGTLLSDIVQVAAGGTCSFAVTSNGQVYAWGNNSNGQLLVGQSPNYLNVATPVPLGFTVKSISAAGSYAVAIRKDSDPVLDDTVWAWGYDGWGQIGIDPTTLPKDTNGNTIQYVDAPTQIKLADGTALTATAVVAGLDHVLALSGGNVYAWGMNYYGELGNNNKNASAQEAALNTVYYSVTPVQVVSPEGAPTAGTGGTTLLAGVTNIYAYGHSSFARLDDGRLVAWGANVYGQLGFPDQSKLGYQENPVVVTGM